MAEPFEDSDLLWPTTSLSEALSMMLDRMEANCSGRLRIVSTGVPGIDQQIDGLPSGEVTVVGGLRGAGATALALRIGKHAAMKGRRILYVTTRDPIVSLTDRLLAEESQVTHRELEQGRIRRSDWDSVGRAVHQLNEIPFSFYDHPVPSIYQIMVVAAQLERNNHLGLVVIDRLHGLRGWDSGRPHL